MEIYPQILKIIFLTKDTIHMYKTRSSKKLNINYKRTNYGKFSIKDKGAQIWNSLPTILKDINLRKKSRNFIQQEHDIYLEEA